MWKFNLVFSLIVFLSGCLLNLPDISTQPLSVSPEVVDLIIPEIGSLDEGTDIALSSDGKWALEGGTEIVVVTQAGEIAIPVEPSCALRWYDTRLLVCGGHFIYFTNETDYKILPVYVFDKPPDNFVDILAEATTIYWYQSLDIFAILIALSGHEEFAMLIVHDIGQIDSILGNYPHVALPVVPAADSEENVEVIISRTRLGGSGRWGLSPNGDKIVYQTSYTTATVLEPISSQAYQIGKCDAPVWIDNTVLQCQPGQTIDTSQFFDTNISSDLSKKSLQDSENGKVWSPNKRYYYLENSTATGLTIYEAGDDQKVAEFNLETYPSDKYTMIVGGWAIDSSGIYFQTPVRGAFSRSYLHTDIRKLLVP